MNIENFNTIKQLLKNGVTPDNIRIAYLRRADLSGANLRQSSGLKFCQFSFSGIGSESRQWLLVHIGGKWKFFCGCWSGSPIKLYHRIKKLNGREQKSRMFAFITMIQAAKFSRIKK